MALINYFVVKDMFKIKGLHSNQKQLSKYLDRLSTNSNFSLIFKTFWAFVDSIVVKTINLNNLVKELLVKPLYL